MRKLVKTKRFERAFRKFTRRDSRLQEHINETLKVMEADIFASALGTRKLVGNLLGAMACSCGYDCRTIFFLESDKSSGTEAIILTDIGTHDEVY